MLTWVDGAVCQSIAVDDRGLLLADGAFETLRWSGLGVFRKEFHIARLIAGLTAMAFDDPAKCAAQAFDQLNIALSSLATREDGFEREEGLARITITRGSGPRGYAPSSMAIPRIVISLFMGNCVSPAPGRMILAKTRWPTQPQFAGFKLLARTEQVLAAHEALQAGAVDALMLGQNNTVISSATGNIFARYGGSLLTPKLDKAGIAGTRRAVILSDLSARLGFEVREVRLSLADVMKADEVFTSNSVVGIRAIAELYTGATTTDQTEHSIPTTRTWSDFSASAALALLIHGEPV